MNDLADLLDAMRLRLHECSNLHPEHDNDDLLICACSTAERLRESTPVSIKDVFAIIESEPELESDIPDALSVMLPADLCKAAVRATKRNIRQRILLLGGWMECLPGADPGNPPKTVI